MRSSKIKFKKILVILIIVFFFAGFWIIYSKLLVVNKITWNLNGVDCVIVSDLDKNINLKGNPLFKLSNSYIEQTIIAKYPCIKSATLTKDLNGNLIINLTNRQAFINLLPIDQSPLELLNNLEASSSSQSALVDSSIPQVSDPSFLADDQGVIFKSGNGEYPSIYVINNRFKIGDHLDSNIISALKAIFTTISQMGTQNLLNAPINQLKIKVEDNTMIVLTDPLLLFNLNKSDDPNKDIYNSLISLQLILKTAKMENKTIKSADFRFDKPVVEYK